MSLTKKITLAVSSVLLGVTALEAGLRILGVPVAPAEDAVVVWHAPDGRDGPQWSEGNGLHERDGETLWRPKPGARVPWGAGERINRRGWRGPLLEVDPPPDVLRVACLGDSSTFGFGVGPESTWPARLADELERQGVRAAVLNAGVICYSSVQSLQRYRTLVRRYEPDLVIAAFGGDNDHYLAIDLIPDLQQMRVIRDRPEAAPALRWLLERSRTMQALRCLMSKDAKRQLAPAPRPGIGLQDAQRRLRSLGEADWPGVRRVAPQEFAMVLRQLEAEVAADGAGLVLVGMPRTDPNLERRPVLAEYTRIVHQVARELELPLFDADARFRSEVEQGSFTEAELFVDKVHPSAAGHRLIGEGLGRLIRARRAR